MKIYEQHKEVINYLIFGVLTTLVSVVSYRFFTLIGINYLISNLLSWIISVTFAYFTNRKYVFESKSNNYLKELILFFSSRITSLLIEMALMFILVDLIKIDDFIAKILCQVVVIVINYILSKLVVFKKDK